MTVRVLGNLADIAEGSAKMMRVALLLVAALVLAACNSGSLSDGLESASRPSPSADVNAANNPGPVATTPAPTTADPNAPATTDPANPQVAALPTGKAVAFLPVSNAPQSAVTTLAKSIRTSAAENGVPVVASVQDGAQYQVKGYFSALEDGSGTLLVYVWDVLDRNNKRVYRINGQEQTSSNSTDPWRSVTPQMLERVADTTIAQLRTWLRSR